MRKVVTYEVYVFNKKSSIIDHVDLAGKTPYGVSTVIINEVTSSNKESVAGYRKALGELVQNKVIEIRKHESVL